MSNSRVKKQRALIDAGRYSLIGHIHLIYGTSAIGISQRIGRALRESIVVIDNISGE